MCALPRHCDHRCSQSGARLWQTCAISLQASCAWTLKLAPSGSRFGIPAPCWMCNKGSSSSYLRGCAEWQQAQRSFPTRTSPLATPLRRQQSWHLMSRAGPRVCKRWRGTFCFVPPLRIFFTCLQLPHSVLPVVLLIGRRKVDSYSTPSRSRPTCQPCIARCQYSLY